MIGFMTRFDNRIVTIYTELSSGVSPVLVTDSGKTRMVYWSSDKIDDFIKGAEN